jgi:Tol biopolymer transport system component
MPEDRDLLERELQRVELRPFTLDGFHRERERKLRNRRIRAGVVALVVVAGAAVIGASIYRSDHVPATPPEEPVDLGIFEPLAGRIVSYRDGSLWGVDPNAPDRESTMVSVDLGASAEPWVFPLGWSRDGTELLLLRSDVPDQAGSLSILHADGTESQVSPDPVQSAAISPDGSRVAFAAPQGQGLYVVDAQGGEPLRIAEEGASPTFSPDGTQIAYLFPAGAFRGPSVARAHVLIVNANGGDAHEILADEPALAWGATSLAWSPAGDRFAMTGGGAMYTFAPDGSNVTTVVPEGAGTPFWSPDGTRLAYRLYFPPGPLGLSVVGADGSEDHTLVFGGDGGPWHPGASAAAPIEMPTPAETSAPIEAPAETPAPVASDDAFAEGLVLRFEADPEGGPGDLVAVDPVTGDSRVLLSDVAGLTRAAWSADHRWVAVENSTGLWVTRSGEEPRRVADPVSLWSWSPDRARLATDDVEGEHHLSVIDAPASTTVDLGEVQGEVTSRPVWSPDGTRLVYGANGGTIWVVDVDSGARSVLVELPDDDLDSVDGIAWSPDGEIVAIFNDTDPGHGRLYLVNADGSDIRVLRDDADLQAMAWSPDGARLAYVEHRHAATQVLTQTRDGDAPTAVAEVPNDECVGFNGCGLPLVWSPDGSRIGLLRGDGNGNATYLAVDTDGNVEPIDAMTYASWNGGSYP